MKDPVCGMQVNSQTYPAKWQGKDYYFCSQNCQSRFQQAPERYIGLEQGRANKAVQTKRETSSTETSQLIYTCPMHPEIQQAKPGDCPICGMALEASGPVVAQGNPEFDDMRRRFYLGAILTLPLLLIAMATELVLQWLPPGTSLQSLQWLEFILATPVVLWGGWPFFQRAVKSILSRHLNMFTLIGLGVSVAYVYSLFAVFLPEIFPAKMRTDEGLVHVYFEAAAVITVLVLLGQVLELGARDKTNDAIKKLLQLAPRNARLVVNGEAERDIPIEQVKVGDCLRIRPGEKIPVDGTLIEGKSNLDESMVTGEPVPVAKSANDHLIGGTINGTGSILMRAEKVGSETLLAQIIKMVSEAQRSRAPIQKLADTVAGYFVPFVIAIAILTFILWFFLGPEPILGNAMVNAVAVLIIACPCALGLATPISIMVSTGRGASEGVLIKNAEALETLEKIDTLVIDKTGTLTEGKPRLVSIEVHRDFDETQVLSWIAGMEIKSEHPLASSIVNGVQQKDIEPQAITEFSSLTGRGVAAALGDKKLAFGNLALMKQCGATDNDPQQLLDKADALRAKGETVMMLSVDAQLVALIGVSDPVKDSASQALKHLRQLGVEVVMLTGDNGTTAQVIADQLNIREFYADLMPDDKAKKVKALQADNKVVAMAGDGINDAPALAQAQIGIAMATGTDVAMESAGITLVKGDLQGIVRAIQLSRQTMANIRQNLFFAFIYNALGIPIAAGALYPVFGILFSPMIAAAAMSFSSVSVILNALRLKKTA